MANQSGAIYWYQSGDLGCDDEYIGETSMPELLQQEKNHLRKALTKCKYPKWALHKVEKRLNWSTSEVIDGLNNQGTTGAQPVTNEVKNKGHIVLPSTQGLCESIK